MHQFPMPALACASEPASDLMLVRCANQLIAAATCPDVALRSTCAAVSCHRKAITIAPPEGVADEFTVPGQYLQIRQPGAEKAGIFAIASAPGAEGPFQFLIKEQPASDWSPGTGWLTGADAGAELEMSQVMGGGFKVGDDVLDNIESVLLFAVGSGISPIRSTIESGVLKGKSVKLYYGAQTPEQMAYTDLFDSWKGLGVEVTPVISKPDGTDWTGATGCVVPPRRSRSAAYSET